MPEVEIEAPVKPLPRRGRLWVILVFLLTLIALGYFVVNFSTQKPAHNKVHIVGVPEAQEIFGGIQQEGDQLGNPSAPVTIEVFSDLQCSSCREDFLTTIPKLAETYAREGEAKLVYHNYSIAENPIELGFYGAEAAAAQDYAWEYIYLFFRNQEEAKRFGIGAIEGRRSGLKKDFLESVAAGVEELEFPEWKEDLEAGEDSDSAMSKRLKADEELGTKLGIREGEAAIVTGQDGTRTLQEGPGLGEIERAIEEVRK